MSQNTLQVEPRELRGKEAAKRMRREGKLPAVIYGHNEPPVSLTLNERELGDLMRHGGAHGLIKLQGVGGEMNAIIKDLQRHPVKNSVQTVDFIRVSMNEEMTVTVPIHVTGEPEDLRTGAGLLVQSLHEISVAATPANLPESISADISGLELNGPALTVAELTMPEGVRLVTDGEEAVAAINPPKKVDVDEPMDELDAEVEAEGEAKAEAEAEANTEAASSEDEEAVAPAAE